MEPDQSWAGAAGGSDIQTQATVELERRNGLAVALIRGDIDTSNADRIELALQAGAAAKETVSGMIVELNGVEYLNSAAIKMLFGLAEQLKTRGQQLRVVMDDTAPMRKVLRTIHFERLVPLDRTVKEAEAQIAAAREAADADALSP
jgi:anti-anti-sigma factor